MASKRKIVDGAEEVRAKKRKPNVAPLSTTQRKSIVREATAMLDASYLRSKRLLRERMEKLEEKEGLDAIYPMLEKILIDAEKAPETSFVCNLLALNDQDFTKKPNTAAMKAEFAKAAEFIHQHFTATSTDVTHYFVTGYMSKDAMDKRNYEFGFDEIQETSNEVFNYDYYENYDVETPEPSDDPDDDHMENDVRGWSGSAEVTVSVIALKLKPVV